MLPAILNLGADPAPGAGLRALADGGCLAGRALPGRGSKGRGKMKRLGICLVLAVLLFWPASGLAQDTRKVLAVVDFEDLVHGRESATEVVTTHLINRLQEEPSVRVLPRHTVQRALTDAKVEGRGLLDPADAQKVGEALGADYIVMGEVIEFNWDSQSVYLLISTLTKRTANVILKGSVLDVALAQPVAQPEGKGHLTVTDASFSVGPWPVGFSADNFDNALIGEATKESVHQFVEQVMSSVK